MKLPQELVDYIVDMIHDHQTLNACSLTCKPLLYSVRRLTYSEFYVTPRAQRFFTEEKSISQMIWNRHNAHLYFLSYMGKRGLLQYVRHIHICLPRTFTPENLLPHLHHFQTLNRVHTLTIRHYDAVRWANDYKACFAHFYPTLTSLSLWYPSGPLPLLLQFAQQFPNLEFLSLLLRNEEIAPVTVRQSPPLVSKLFGVYPVAQRPAVLFNELPNKLSLRSVELGRLSNSHAQHILDACASTLERLTIIHHEHGAR